MAGQIAGWTTAGWVRNYLLDPALSLLFPPRCVVCGRFETYLCPRCRVTLSEVGKDVCPRCGHPAQLGIGASGCSVCTPAPPSFAQARSAFIYSGAGSELVTALKFGGQRELAGFMAELARDTFLESLTSLRRPVMTWVPAHRKAERKRGYNQARVLAEALSRAAEPHWRAEAARLAGEVLPVRGLARKTRPTKHQQTLDRSARARNLRGAFEPAPALSELHSFDAILLVDDVYTTGSTVNEVASVLHEASGLPVHVFTFCRTLGSVAGGVS